MIPTYTHPKVKIKCNGAGYVIASAIATMDLELQSDQVTCLGLQTDHIELISGPLGRKFSRRMLAVSYPFQFGGFKFEELQEPREVLVHEVLLFALG